MTNGNDKNIRSWRRISAAALLVASVSIAVTAVLFWQAKENRDAIRHNVAKIAQTTRRLDSQAAKERSAERARLADTAQRLDQTCTLFEGDHKADVEGLKLTYRYLRDLPEDEWRLAINQLIVRQLPMTEREARTDRAPDFCDDPGRGLKEPDPVLPKKQDFSYILRAAK